MDKLILSTLVILACSAGSTVGRTCDSGHRAVTADDFQTTLMPGTTKTAHNTRDRWGGSRLAQLTYLYTYESKKPKRVRLKLEQEASYRFFLYGLNLTLTNVKEVKLRLHQGVSDSQTLKVEEVYNVTGDSLSLSWPTPQWPLSRLYLTAAPKLKGKGIVRINSLTACNTRRYEGCYDVHYVEGSQQRDSLMTVEKCRKRCLRVYLYAALTFYDDWGNAFDDKTAYCYCFDRNSNGKVDESKCNMTCPGDESEICGGRDHMSLFMKRRSYYRMRSQNGRGKI